MENKEIDRQLGELWKKAAGSEYKPESPFADVRPGESGIDTVKFLKNNFSKAEADWKRLLDTKDVSIRELTSQLEETRAHLNELKQQYQEARERLINEELGVALNLEESRKLLDAQKKNHARETILLKEVLERTRVEMQSMAERLEALRAERDQWQRKCGEAAMSESDLKDSVSGMERKLADAKEAVERTLSELLAERKDRQTGEKKLKEADKKISELEAQAVNTRANWDAERKEWRELWDRERSVWETHRQEFAVWEERLRSERQAWTDRIRQEGEKGIGYAAGLADVLKESSQWSEKVSQILKLYALKGVQLPTVFVAPEKNVAVKSRKTALKMLTLTLAGLLVMAGAAWRIHDYRSKAHFTSLGQYSLESSNAAALAVSEDGVWVADWDKGLMLKDIKDLSTLRIMDGAKGEPFRPAAVAAYDGGVWVLDMAQLRFIKKDPRTGGELESVKTPGPAPQGVAWDGLNLWSFDAATGLLYKYGLDPKAGVSASYEVPGLKNLSAMQWVRGELWTLDAKNILSRYSLKNGVFSRISSQIFKGRVLAFDVAGGDFWTLESSKNQNGFEIKKYAVKTY